MSYLFSIKTDIFDKIPGEVYTSLLIAVVIIILAIIVNIKAKKANPLEKPKGILLIAEIAVEKCDNFVAENMGKIFVEKLSPYIGFVMAYIFISFIISLFGFPSPMVYYVVPLILALGTFILIHFTAMKYQKLKYFQRFVSPFPIFLPINLISMWAPLISMSFRLFGNACAGWVLMKLVYGTIQMVSEMLFGGVLLPIAVFITPPLHAYFDLFSAYVQTIIFAYLTMLLVASEVPDDIDVDNLELVK